MATVRIVEQAALTLAVPIVIAGRYSGALALAGGLVEQVESRLPGVIWTPLEHLGSVTAIMRSWE